jgi:hypothetical protein
MREVLLTAGMGEVPRSTDSGNREGPTDSRNKEGPLLQVLCSTDSGNEGGPAGVSVALLTAGLSDGICREFRDSDRGEQETHFYGNHVTLLTTGKGAAL